MRRRELPLVLMASAAGMAAAPAIARESMDASSLVYSPTASELRVHAAIINAAHPPGDVRRYGAVGDGKADDSRALQQALDAAHAGGYAMYLPAGTYRITKQISKSHSFRLPYIHGDGHQYSRILYEDIKDQAALYIQGGSGRHCGGIIEGIALHGSSGSYGIEIDGQDGVVIRDCAFGANAVGLRLHNRSMGSFTEYVVAENCVFDAPCATALQYRVGKGGNSFNGSGLRNSMIQCGSSGGVPIDVGQGASPYNAPLAFQIWTRGNNQTIIQNSSRRPVLFHGTITIEVMGLIRSQEESPVVAAGDPVYLVGGVESAGYVNYGSLKTGTRAGTLGRESGAANGQRLIRSHNWTVRVPIATGSAVLGNIREESSVLLHVFLLGRKYDYRCVLLASMQGYGGSGFVKSVSVLNSFDEMGYGAPSFRVDEKGNIIVENSGFPSTGVTAYMDVMPFGLNVMAYLASAAEYGNAS